MPLEAPDEIDYRWDPLETARRVGWQPSPRDRIWALHSSCVVSAGAPAKAPPKSPALMLNAVKESTATQLFESSQRTRIYENSVVSEASGNPLQLLFTRKAPTDKASERGQC